MPDQELTALRIKIEADVKAALDKLDALSAKMVAVSSQVVSSVTRINTALKTIDGKVIDLKVNVQGNREINSLKKQLEEVRAAAGNAVNAPASNIPQVRQRQQAVVPAESEISSFVSAVKAGVAVSVEELKKFRSALTALFESKQLRLGVDDTEVQQLKKDLEFLNGFINASKRDIKVRVSTEGDAEIRQKLNNLQKDYVLRIIPSFNDADFNKLLTEIQNKRINLTFEDVSDAIKEEIRKVEAISANLPIGADTSAYDSKVNQLRNSLTKVQAIQVNADTKPAELSLKQLQDRATNILAKQQELKLRAQILLPSGELSALNATKKRLEADKIRLKGTAEFGEINANLEAVKRRIAELNTQGVKLQVTTGEIISNASVQKVNNAIALVKELKKTAGDIRVDFKGNGLDRLNGQANQTVRNIEQIIRDTPSFAISAQQGFIAISNNIGPLTDSFGRLAAEARASGQSIGKALVGALGGWNAIGIAISLAVTAVAVFGKEIFGASEKAKALKDEFEEIKKLVNSTKFTTSFGVAKQTGQITEVERLVELAKQVNSNPQQSRLALDKLIEIDPNAFGNIGKGADAVNKLDTAFQQYKGTLLAVSVVQEKKNKVDELAVKQAEVAFKVNDANRKVLAERLKLAQLELKAASSPQVITGTNAQLPQIQVDLENQRAVVRESEKNFKTYVDQFSALRSGIAKEQAGIKAIVAGTLTEITDLSGSLADDNLKKFLESRKALLEAELKNTSNLSKRYFDIQAEIAGIDLQISNIGEADSNIKFNNFKIFEETIKGIDNAAKEAKVEVGNLIAELSGPIRFDADNIRPFVEIREQAIDAQKKIDELFRSGNIDINGKAKLEAELQFRIEQDVEKAQKELDSYQLLIKTGIAPQLEPVIPDQTFEDLPELPDFDQWAKDSGYAVEDWGQKLRNSLKPLEDGQKAAEQLANELENLIAGVIADGLGDLAESFLEGTLTLQKFGDQLAQIAKDLTVALIKFAAFTAIKAALPGIGGILGLATGGIATGPTLAMIGEGRESEAVLPLSYLRNLIGGDAAPGGRLTAELSMDSIIFALDRNARRQGRSFGG